MYVQVWFVINGFLKFIDTPLHLRMQAWGGMLALTSFFIVNFEHILYPFLAFLLLTMNM